jgi:hypothetical protein
MYLLVRENILKKSFNNKMQRFWLVDKEISLFLEDSIYNSKYRGNNIFKDSFIKKEKGLYYTSFNKKTWLRIDPRTIHYLPNPEKITMLLFIIISYLNILDILLVQLDTKCPELPHK